MMASRDRRHPSAGDDSDDEADEPRPQVVPLRSRAGDRAPPPPVPVDEPSIMESWPEEASPSTSASASAERRATVQLPRLRSDLLVTPTDGGTVRVRAPESATQFSIYDVEWKVAQAMDGTRSLADIARIAGRQGLAADEKLVRSLVQELKGYRFLDTSNAPPASRRTGIQEVIAAAISDEERSLAEAATTVLADSGEEQLTGHLSAILAINPGNTAAKAMQDELSTRAPAPAQQRITKEPTGPAAPIVIQYRHRRLLYVVAGVALVAVVVAASLVYQANRALNEALTRAQPVVVEPPPLLPPSRVAPVATDTVDSPSAVHLEVVAQLRTSESVRCRSSGVVAELPVKPGDTVKRGTVIAVVADESSYARYAAARRQLTEVEQRASRDPVVRYFLSGARAKFRKAIAKLKIEKATAQREGTVANVGVSIGDTVAAASVLAETSDGRELVASVPAKAIPFAIEGADCTVDGGAGPCILTQQPGGAFEVVIDNARRTLHAGDPVSISIAPPQAPRK